MIRSLCVLLRNVVKLEAHFETNFTDSILSDADSVNLSEMKQTFRTIDKKITFDLCETKAPFITKVTSLGCSWPKLWDQALHHGSKHLCGLRNLSRILAHHGQGTKPCPLCDRNSFSYSLTEHVWTEHRNDIGIPNTLTSLDSLLEAIVHGDSRIVYKFWKTFSNF